nr:MULTISPECIES: GNAT family N-acetyltransferase [Amycolatopsis]
MHFRPLTEPAQHRLRGTAERGRTIVAVDEGEIVGGVTVVSRELTVPGAVVPVAEVVAVSPAQDWLLAELLGRQLTELYESGETIASGAGSCARFGFGPAARAVRLHARGVLRPDADLGAGRIRLLDGSSAGALLEPVYDAVRPRSVGWTSRPPRFWDTLLTSAAVHDSPEGEVTGYALYRRGDAGALRVAEGGRDDGPGSRGAVAVPAGGPSPGVGAGAGGFTAAARAARAGGQPVGAAGRRGARTGRAPVRHAAERGAVRVRLVLPVELRPVPADRGRRPGDVLADHGPGRVVRARDRPRRGLPGRPVSGDARRDEPGDRATGGRTGPDFGRVPRRARAVPPRGLLSGQHVPMRR